MAIPPFGAPVSKFVIRTPGTALRNTITPTADIVPLTIQAKSGQTAQTQQWLKSDGTVLAAIESGADTKRIKIGGHGYTLVGTPVMNVIATNTEATARFISRGAYGTTTGAGIQAQADAGSAVTSGARLGYVLFGGARDAASTIANTVGFEAFSTEAFASATNLGSELRLNSTAAASGTRTTRLTITDNGQLKLHDVTAPAGNPSGGVFLYSQSGVLKWKSPGGTVYDLSVTGGGGMSQPVTTTVSTNYAILSSDDYILASGTITVTLPVPADGIYFTIKNVGTGVITIAQHATDLIDGAASQTLDTQYAALSLVSNGTDWFIV
jgi:hypothetical protein